MRLEEKEDKIKMRITNASQISCFPWDKTPEGTTFWFNVIMNQIPFHMVMELANQRYAESRNTIIMNNGEKVVLRYEEMMDLNP